jgi:hypothetical protein
VASVWLAVALAVGVSAHGQAGDASCVPHERDGSCLPVAPASERVDLATPSFSNPTSITNPLFPIGDIASVVMLGQIDGKPFRTEVTLLPETKVIDWNGQPVETLVFQYVAFIDGHLHEVALDWYAQADDGSVWYFGEDVVNYVDGVAENTDGTWIAGDGRPPGMIMPARPRVGAVYRPENIPGLVFEEVTVAATEVTVDGPRGSVSGAIVVRELHQDGSTEEKTFAPGYGEFLAGGGGELEAVALAVPTDQRSGSPPADLEALMTGAAEVAAAAEAGCWDDAAAAVDSMVAVWEAYQAADLPPRLASRMADVLAALAAAVEANDPASARLSAIEAAQTGLDFQLMYRTAVEIDRARLDLHAQRLLVDTAASDLGAVNGDVATLDWIWDRIAHTEDPATAERLEARLANLRSAAAAGDLAAITTVATELRTLLAAR